MTTMSAPAAEPATNPPRRVDTSFQGRVFPPGEPFQVGRESLRAFAAAVGAESPEHRDVDAARAAGYADLVAPPTYAVVIAQRCEATYVSDPASGIDFSRVVHAEEKFIHHRPIVAGDEVIGTVYVDRVRQMGGHAMVTTRTELALADRTPVATVVSSLVVRGDDDESANEEGA